MLISFIAILILNIPPAITSESSWTSPDIVITEEWSLNILDRIEPAYAHLGTVYDVEDENGFHWHTILVDKEYVLHFEENTLVDSIPYSGNIWRMTFSPDCRYLLGYCDVDKRLLLFDLSENTVVSYPLFSQELDVTGNPILRVTNSGTVLIKHNTYLRLYDSSFNCIISRDNFSWGGRFIAISDSGDHFYVESNNSIQAFDIEGNIVRSIDLPVSVDENSNRAISLSGTGELIAVTDFNRLLIFETDTGNMITDYCFDDAIGMTVFSASDLYIVVNCLTHPEVTPLQSINSFGLRTFSVDHQSVEICSEFHFPNIIEDSSMPYFFHRYFISDNGVIIGKLYYKPGLHREVLLTRDLEYVWLSDNLSDNSNWYYRLILQQEGISRDNSTFWFFDGETIHSYLIESI
jgi:hypothetical protein